MGIGIGTVDRSVATRTHAAALRQPGIMSPTSINLYRRRRSRWRLRMALQAKIGIALHQHLRVDRTVNGMAGRATLPKRRMFEHMRPRLLTVALRAVLIVTIDKLPLRKLDVFAMGVVAVLATHPAFLDGMVIRHVELSLLVYVALEAHLRVLHRVDNELAAPATSLNVEAACPMATLTSHSLPFALGVGNGYARVKSRLKVFKCFLVTRPACFHADVFRTGDHRWSHHHPVYRRAREREDRNRYDRYHRGDCYVETGFIHNLPF